MLTFTPTAFTSFCVKDKSNVIAILCTALPPLLVNAYLVFCSGSLHGGCVGDGGLNLSLNLSNVGVILHTGTTHTRCKYITLLCALCLTEQLASRIAEDINAPKQMDLPSPSCILIGVSPTLESITVAESHLH